MLHRAADRILEFGPWAEAPVLLACSGGADSTFLACAWRDAAARPAAQLPPAICAVVDHGHRPGTERESAAAAERLRGLGLEAVVLRADAPADANESVLRDARYRQLQAEAERRGAAHILTAHHADDLAETVLLRIFRGTGLRGLAGIPARRQLADGIEVLRPLLSLRRAAMREALRSAGVDWQEDPTNAIPDAARNRLRLEVLPALAGIATGDPVLAVLRLAAEAGEWNQALDELLAAAPQWVELPAHLRRQAIAVELRRIGATVSPARLRDLEGALLRRGRAGVEDGVELRLQNGRLA